MSTKDAFQIRVACELIDGEWRVTLKCEGENGQWFHTDCGPDTAKKLGDTLLAAATMAAERNRERGEVKDGN